MKVGRPKHAMPLPHPRTVRRACSKELYRTCKRLGHHVPANLVKEAVDLYTKRVIENLAWVTLHQSNRKRLADWWDEAVCNEIATLWQVDAARLSAAFRDAFGG